MSGKGRDFQNFDIKGVREANADLQTLVIQLEQRASRPDVVPMAGKSRARKKNPRKTRRGKS
jgi:hypothetical protein